MKTSVLVLERVSMRLEAPESCALTTMHLSGGVRTKLCGICAIMLSHNKAFTYTQRAAAAAAAAVVSRAPTQVTSQDFEPTRRSVEQQLFWVAIVLVFCMYDMYLCLPGAKHTAATSQSYALADRRTCIIFMCIVCGFFGAQIGHKQCGKVCLSVCAWLTQYEHITRLSSARRQQSDVRVATVAWCHRKSTHDVTTRRCKLAATE